MCLVFHKYSILMPCKESNDAAATYTLLLRTNWDSLFFDIITHNSSFFCFQLMTISNPTPPKHTHKRPGINTMGLGDPWANSYLQYQQKEHYSVIFINQFLLIFLRVLLILLIKTNLMNLRWLPWRQSIYTWKHIKYPVTHKKIARD